VFSLTDIDQTSDQIAHHVVQEGRGLEIEDEKFAETLDVRFAHEFYG